MFPEGKATRPQRRALGKRKLRQEALRDVKRVLKLAEEGLPPSAIAKSTRLSVRLVGEIVARAAEVEEGEGGR